MQNAENGARNRIFIITAEKVVPTGQLTFHFIFDIECSFMRIAKFLGEEDTYSIPYGLVQRRKPQGQGAPRDLFFPSIRQMRRKGKLAFHCPVWEVAVGNQRQQTVYIEADNEKELIDELRALPDCILLMELCDFKPWFSACSFAGIPVEVHHHPGTLWTSRNHNGH